MTHETETAFVKPSAAAMALGVPEAWLRREIDAGRVPFLRAGKSALVNVDAVRAALLERTAADKGVARA